MLALGRKDPLESGQSASPEASRALEVRTVEPLDPQGRAFFGLNRKHTAQQRAKEGTLNLRESITHDPKVSRTLTNKHAPTPQFVQGGS